VSDEDLRSFKVFPTGCAFSIALLIVPGLVAFSFDHLTGEDWPFALFYGVLFAFPFGYLALEGIKAWLPWVVAIVTTACFWGALIVSILMSVRDKSGVNFGMGLLMLASPLIVTACAWVAVQVVRRGRA
jgi:hypothetical protein